MFNKKIFRNKAVEKLSSPEVFDIPLKIVSIRSWMWMLALIAILLAGFIWLAFSKINQEVEVRGIIVKEDHLTEILAARDGFIDKLFVNPEDTINKGDLILSLVSPEEKQQLNENENLGIPPEKLYSVIKTKSEMKSPVDGVVFEQIANEGNFVKTGDKLITIEKKTSSAINYDFEISALVPARMISSMKPGTDVLISPKNIDVKEYGYLTGEIKRIPGYPVSQERMNFLEKNNPLAFGEIKEKVFEVTIIPKMVNGKGLWTSNKEPITKFINGAACSLKIIVSNRSIFSYIIH